MSRSIETDRRRWSVDLETSEVDVHEFGHQWTIFRRQDYLIEAAHSIIPAANNTVIVPTVK